MINIGTHDGGVIVRDYKKIVVVFLLAVVAFAVSVKLCRFIRPYIATESVEVVAEK